MRFARFARGQQKFRGFNFHEWLLTREKRENKSLAKITNHTVSLYVVLQATPIAERKGLVMLQQ